MATGRISGAGLRTSQATGRVSGAAATVTTGAVGRISGAGLTATSGATGRISGFTLTSRSRAGVTTANLDDLEPGVPVSVNPVIAGATPTSIVWACNLAGVKLVQDPSTGTLTYLPPATRDGVDLTWTVTVTTTAGATLTASATHTVLPHAGGWMAKADGSGLYPVLVGALLPGQGTSPSTGSDAFTDAFTDSF